jgi:hypothetical protein
VGCYSSAPGATYYASPKPSPNLLVVAIVCGSSDVFPDARTALRLQAMVMAPWRRAGSRPVGPRSGLGVFFKSIFGAGLVNQLTL